MEVYEYYSYSSSDGEGDELQLAFPEENIDPEVSEYLRSVRAAAQAVPRVVMLKNWRQNPAKEQKELAAKAWKKEWERGYGTHKEECDSALLPDSAWESSFCSSFLKEKEGLKYQIELLKNSNPQSIPPRSSFPAIEDEMGWWQYFSGIAGIKRKRSDSDEEMNDSETGNLPLISTIARFEPVLVDHCLEYIANGIAGLRTNLEKEKSQCYIPKNVLLWAYSLLLRLDEPIVSDTASSIRLLYKECCHQRSCLSSVTDKETIKDFLAHLNIIITICGKIYHQEDII